MSECVCPSFQVCFYFSLTSAPPSNIIMSCNWTQMTLGLNKTHAHTLTPPCLRCAVVDKFLQWSQMRGAEENKYFCNCEGALLSARRNARITRIECDWLGQRTKAKRITGTRKEQMNYLICTEVTGHNPRRASISFQLAGLY